jgi:hypothetical protein
MFLLQHNREQLVVFCGDAFQRRSAVSVKDFVPIFVERDVRRDLRAAESKA